jgi:hypothetical protein
MKQVYWSFRKDGDKVNLGVCFDLDEEGHKGGHDQCGSFDDAADAVHAAYCDGLSAPEKNANGRAVEDRISAAAIRIAGELEENGEADLHLPLTDEEEL